MRKLPVSANRTEPHISTEQPPEFIKLLANDVRWGLLKTLSISDYQVNELVAQLEQPMNLISYHLRKLRDDALVTTRRSEADGRDVYYSLDIARLRQLYVEAGMTLHPSIGAYEPSTDRLDSATRRILFLCTHNSARSQMAEGWLRHLSRGQLDVFSAGSQPTQIHSEAIRTMEAFGIDLRRQQPHHLSEFADQPFDYVITVCDKVREVCPTFPGEGQQIHWGFPDPSIIRDDQPRADAFLRTARQIRTRIEYFLTTLPRTNQSEGPSN
jgi:protein-tyrosine-phosphatase/DNA-binding transcriptional ArsR family regulator